MAYMCKPTATHAHGPHEQPQKRPPAPAQPQSTRPHTTAYAAGADDSQAGVRGVLLSSLCVFLRAMPKAGPNTLLCGAQRAGQPRGVTCTLRAGWGTDHVGHGACRKHGGNIESHRRKAQREMAVEEVVRLGVGTGRLVVDPAQALLDALWGAAADVQLYDRLLAELEGNHDAAAAGGGSALYGETFHLTGEKTGEAKEHILVKMRADARKEQASYAAACLKAKVAEQRVKQAQDMALAVSDGFRALCLALGHSPADPTVRQAMRASLQLVSASQAAA